MEQVKLNTFGRYPAWVRPRLRGKFAAVATLTELVCLMDNKKNTVRISHTRLAQRMGCGVSTVRRAIDVLVAEGIILREASLHTSNVYTVLFGGESVDWNDWETLGEDPETQKAPAVKGRIPRLISFFASEVEMHTPMSVQSATNAKALGKHFKDMLDEQGVTEHQLKTMMTLFAVDLERGDRSVEDIPPWRMFLADRQKLLTRVREGTEDIVYIDEMPPAE
tara:strand:- start:10881 stop:11546 length:666 start_codon:yes stop_codon:yes gene_type:complete